MAWNPFTEEAHAVVERAHEVALDAHSTEMAPEHLILAALDDPGSKARLLLEAMAVSIDRLRIDLTTSVVSGGAPAAEMVFTPDAKRMIEQAFTEAQQLGRNEITSDHLLLGILGIVDSSAERTLRHHGVLLDPAHAQARTL